MTGGTTDDGPAGDEQAERVAHLTGLIQRYTSEWRDGDLEYGPWPDDPDGGELRLVMCLKMVLPYLPHEALTLGETEPLVAQRQQAAQDRTHAVLDDAAAYLESGEHRPEIAGVMAVKIRHVLKKTCGDNRGRGGSARNWQLVRHTECALRRDARGGHEKPRPAFGY